MSLKKSRLFILSILSIAYVNAIAGTVDSLEIPSAAMNKTYKAAVVLPSTYQNNKKVYPVLYLLHGGGGHFRDWLNLTPDKTLVKNLADQYNIIIVMPEGETFSWYLDNSFDPNSKFETYITKEVI